MLNAPSTDTKPKSDMNRTRPAVESTPAPQILPQVRAPLSPFVQQPGPAREGIGNQARLLARVIESPEKPYIDSKGLDSRALPVGSMPRTKDRSVAGLKSGLNVKQEAIDSAETDQEEDRQKKKIPRRKAIQELDQDPLEAEADRYAEYILLGLTGLAETEPQQGAPSPGVERQTSIEGMPDSVQEVLREPGAPLPGPLRNDMEQRFGVDFSRVRIHTGCGAERSAGEIRAHAYTVGQHIVFGGGGFAPASIAGKRLLAHELTHVIQQTGNSAIAPPPPIQAKTSKLPGKPARKPAAVTDTGGGEASAVPEKKPAKAQPANTDAQADKLKPDKTEASGGKKKDAKEAAADNPPPDAAEKSASSNDGEPNLLIPPPPEGISPDTAGRIQGIEQRAGDAAAAHDNLPPSGDQVQSARQAVTEPEAEARAKAQQELINMVQAAPSPEIVKLCERIRQVIRDKRPPDEDALMKAQPAEDALNAGKQLNSTVEGESKKVQDNYSDLNKPQGSVDVQKGQDLQAQPPAGESKPLDAKAASPDPVPADNVSLDKDVDANKQKIQDAGMDTEPAKLIESGPVAEAREGQNELEQTAKTDPAKVLAGQKEALGKAENNMAALQAQALAALKKSHESGSGNIAKQQKDMVGSEADQREKAGNSAKKIFSDAQSQVETLLKPLAENAMAEWDAAKTVLVTQFKTDLAIVQKRVDDRHSGVSGWFVGVWDAVTGLPDWATEAYDLAERNFGDGVIDKITAISTQVNAVIAACDLIIKNARQDIAKIYADLPDSLRDWAQKEQARFDGELDKLHNKAIAARDSFNKDLIDRSSQAVDEVRTQIAELRAKAGGIIGRIANAIGRFLDDPIKFIIEGLLELVGIDPAAFWAVIAKIKQVAKDIAKDPLGFANNLLQGLADGFSRFFDNFGSHLLKGFIGWLTGGLAGVGVELPKDFSVGSIVTFFLQLMGITWPRIRKVLAKQIGEKNIALIEKVYSLVSFLIEKGPEGIYDMIKEKLEPQAIVDQVIQMAVDFLVSAIIKQAAVRLIALFNPAGAIFQALEAIYRVLKWVFQNAARIFTLIQTVVNGIADILSGNLGGFAKAVESGLAMLIAPVISFIADYLSLGDLPDKIAKKIKSFQDWIMGLIETALTWLIEKGKALLGLVGKGLGAAKAWWEDKESFNDKEGEGHKLYYKGEAAAAQLIIESEPMPFQRFLDQMKSDANSAPDKDAKLAKINAPQTVFTELRELQKQPEASKPPAADEEGGKSAAASDINAKIVEKTNELGKLAGELIEGDKSTPPEYAGLSSGGFGGGVTVKKITKQHQPGSEPGVDSAGWDALNQRAKGNGAYYIRGHLLNHWLGGSGETWANLTPITGTANTNMSSSFEESAKSLVNGGGVITDFHVAASYAGSGGNSALIGEIEMIQNEGGASIDPKVENALANKKKLIEAESLLPSSLSGSYKDKDGKELKTLNLSNTIESGRLEDYRLKGDDYDPVAGFNKLMAAARESIKNTPDITWTEFRKANGSNVAMLERFGKERKASSKPIQELLTENWYFQNEKSKIDGLTAPFPSWEKFKADRVAYTSTDKVGAAKQSELRSYFDQKLGANKT